MIHAKIICGAANNQLEKPEMADALMERDILYCPDYVVNGGGIINVASELSGTYDKKWVCAKLDGLVETLNAVIAKSESTVKNTDKIAEAIALSRISNARA